MGWLRRIILAAALLTFTVTMPTTRVAAQDVPTPADAPSWAPLGPSGPFQGGSVTVSSGWPDDPFLVVTLSAPASDRGLSSKHPAAARSYDGGQTWEALPDFPTGPVTAIWTERYGRVLVQRRAGSQENRTSGSLFRSTDDGQTWSTIRATVPRADSRPVPPETIIVSPDVYHDAHLILVEDAAVFQSYDAGASWESLNPVTGQRIGTVLFSPDVANDGTLFLTANSGPFSNPWSGPRDELADQHHATSAGIMVSHDHGRTWDQAGDGPQIEGDPYRQIASLAISPTFARDGTLFAYAWGPWFSDSRGGYRGPHVALFRSQDRGQTWTSVWEPFSRARARRGGVGSRTYVTPALSPAFAENGLVLTTYNSSSGSPASGHCNLLRSEDYGQTWTSKTIVLSYGGCWGLFFGGGPPDFAFYSYSGSGSGGWGSTRPGLSLPVWRGFGPRFWSWSPYGSPGPVVARDGTIFTAGVGGIWAAGPSARTTNGRLPCSVPDSQTSAAAMDAAIYARPWLGCPITRPYGTRVGERRLADALALWTDDNDRRSTVLYGPPGPDSGVSRLPKPESRWTGLPDRIVDGEMQRYQGGFVLRMPRRDGSWSTFVVSPFIWQEVIGP